MSNLLWGRCALPLTLVFGLATVGFSQEETKTERELEAAPQGQDGPRLQKKDERSKFHPNAVKGSPASLRQAAFLRRERLKKESLFGGIKWVNVGPEIQGGRVIDIEAPANDPDSVFVAFATGGLYKTQDDGLTWTSLFDDQSSYGIGSIAVSKDGKTVWVGTGEANSQRTSYAGTGVYKSIDSGKTWTNVGLPESHHIGKVIIDPRREDTVYVAVLGHLYSQNEERGLYKTTDGGKTWKKILGVDEYTGAIDVILNPRNPDELLVSMWDRDRRAWNFRESGAGSGVFRSSNGGNTWQKVSALPAGDAAGRTGLAAGKDQPNVVYAFVDNQADDPEWEKVDERAVTGRLTVRRLNRLTDATFAELDVKALEEFLKAFPKYDKKAAAVLDEAKAKTLTLESFKSALKKLNPTAFEAPQILGELYRSDDFGKTWSRKRPVGGIGGYYWGKVFVNPRDADEVFVTGVPLLRSKDGGKTWKSVAEEAHVDHHAVWHDPRNAKKVWIGNDGGVYLSYDSGDTVRHINNLSVAQATTVAVDNKRPYNVYVGNQDNGTMRGPSTYRPGKSDLSLWTDLFGGDGSAIAIDPRDDSDRVYVAYQFGQHFAIEPKLEARYITPRAAANEDPLRYNWVSPLIISSHHPDILYVGSQKLHRSFNRGANWTSLSTDLTKNRLQGDVPHSTIKDLSESPLRFGLIYAGTDDGKVQMTPDGGYQWVDVSTPQPDKWVSRVVASRYDVATVYVAQNGYRDDDWNAYLWKSTDFGKTWKSIVGNLPSESINVVREDPKSKDILYVGTDMGVYVTLDAGATWQTLSGGMPNLPVHDLAIQERMDDLVAGTHARGAYIIDLEWIRKVNKELLGKDITILESEDMTRRATWGYDRREVWDDKAPNEPKLKVGFFTNQAGSSILRLRDAKGAVVAEVKLDALKGFNTGEISLQLTPEKPDVPGSFESKTATEVLKDPFAGRRPTYLPAGEYTLEVEIGGKIEKKAWKLKEG
jgi:photosystem II stability/assembly factor-like uncharacterized protein